MKRWISFAVVGAAILAVLVYCQMRRVQVSVSPAPVLHFIADSEQELTRLPVSFGHLSDADEIDIGNHLARAYLARWPQPAEEDADDLAVRGYVEKVGARVAAHAHRRLPYKFDYIPEMDFINAFALPGGHVYIGAGLIARMDSEDELAAVLGHEIEHIDHYHCAERVETQEALRHVPLGALAAITVEIFEAGYSKDQELEADREGTRLAVLAGYSPLGAIRMFETFDRLEHVRMSRAQTPQQELSGVAEQTFEGYFRSHPPPSERIAQIKRMVREEKWMDLPAERKLAVASIFRRFVLLPDIPGSSPMR
ncbi:MAG TPA: M48 family metalloprotease [Terriglobia bacterium]|nr:M48 family metalloprotease [Terriglobia bacterium]